MKTLIHRGKPNRNWRKKFKLALIDEIRVFRWTLGMPQVRPVEMKVIRETGPMAGCIPIAPLVADETGARSASREGAPTSCPRFPVPYQVRQAMRRMSQEIPRWAK